jgi:hypothetical protein
MRLDPRTEILRTGQTVGDYWAWAFSDVDTNVLRAVYAEWLVGTALDCVGEIRQSWTPWDLDYGDSKIEVKSTSYYPNWGQLVEGPRISRPEEREAPRVRKPNSRRDFDIKATSATFPADPAVLSGPDADYYEKPEIRRWADVYVFAYYAERDPTQYSSLRVNGWKFYVLSTPEVEEHFGPQERVALGRVQAAAREAKYENLRATVDTAIDRVRTEGQ